MDFSYKMKKKWIILAFCSLFLIAFSLRFFPLRIAHFWDETVYLQHAEIFSAGRVNFSELSFRPPLLSIIFSLGFIIWHSAIMASFLTAFLTALVPIVIFLIGRKIYNFQIGILGGLISAFLPFLIRNSNYLLTDVPVIFFMGLAFYFSLFKGKRTFLFFSGVFFGLAVLMKFTAVLLFPVLMVSLFFNKESWKNFLIFVSGGAIVLLPYFIWCYVQFGNPIKPFLLGTSFVGDKNEHTFYYLSHFYEAFTYFVIFGLVLWICHLLFKLIKKSYFSLKYDVILVIWVLIFFIYLTKTPHKELRYILPITIPVILLACKGWSSILYFIKKGRLLFWIIFILYLLSLIHPRIDYISETGFVDTAITDEMKIADYLKEINYTGIIYSNQRWPVLAYYTGLETRLLFPDNDAIYNLIPEIMKDSGLVIGMYTAVKFEPFKHPFPERMDSDKRFKHIKDIGDFFIYEYTPD